MRVRDATTPGTARRWSCDWAGYGAAVALLLTLGVLIVRLALAPIHGTRSAAACARAYAAARTHADTMSADLLTYPEPARQSVRQRRLCGRLRIVTVDLARR